jgi:hydrogenase nickel incorporation protein HypA/HybF
MHEFTITRSLVTIACEAAAGRRVHCVKLDIGKLSGVVPDAIAFCFDAATQGTVLEGAQLNIRQIDGRARCRDCSAEFTVETMFGCCRCGSRRLMLMAGEELDLRAIELEEAV